MKKLLVALLIVALIPQLAFGGWTFSAKAESAGAVTTAVTVDDLVIVWWLSPVNDTTTTAHFCDDDSGGSNTYNYIDTIQSDRPARISVSWMKAKATNAILTITPYTTSGCSTGVTTEHIHVARFTNSGGANYALDTNAKTISTCSQALTTGVANTLLLAATEASGAVTQTTMTEIYQHASTARMTTAYDVSSNSAGSNTVAMSCPTPRGIIGVAMKETTGAGGTTIRHRVTGQ